MELSPTEQVYKQDIFKENHFNSVIRYRMNVQRTAMRVEIMKRVPFYLTIRNLLHPNFSLNY